MLEFNVYQNIFEIEDTKTRCQEVLKIVHPKMKELMEIFIKNNEHTLGSMDIELTSNVDSNSRPRDGNNSTGF